LADLDVLILCGGLGTRLSSVLPNRPKSLAPIGEKVFLDILIQELQKFGIKRLILCGGFLGEQIIEYFKDRNDYDFKFSIEKSPLGTGGAVKNAESLLRSGNILVMNGDSLCQVDYHKFHSFHLNHQELLSMVLSPNKDREDVGNIKLDTAGKILSFQEKHSDYSTEWINAGIYLMQRSILSTMPAKDSFSLEHDFFPKMVQKQHCYGFPVENKVIDIGTPERYSKIQQILD